MQKNSSLPQALAAEAWPHLEAIMDHSEVVVISCLFWWMDKDPVITRRTLEDSLLYVPVRGRLRCRVGSAEKTLGPGEFLMAAEGVEHEAWRADDADEYFEAYSIHVNAYTVWNQPLLSLFSSPFGRFPGAEAWFQQLALLTHILGKDQDLGGRFGESLLRSLLVQQLSVHNVLTELPVADDPRVWRARLHVLRHCADPLRVEGLAAKAGISTVQFRKLFKRYTGMPPQRYIQQIRLRKAWALLRTNSTLTVKEVAQQTGFSDAHYLHAAFKDAYGMTPGECRRLRI